MSAALQDIKARNRRLLESERLEKRVRLASLPLQVQIEPANRCNLACPSCARNDYDAAKNPPRDLDPARYPALVTLFTHAESVLLGGYGEPLLGKFTEAILRLAADCGCEIQVITNGMLADGGFANLARELAVGRVIFSVDAATDEGMRRARGVGLTEILARVNSLREASPKTQIAFNFTLNAGNLGDLGPLLDVAAQNGITRIAVAHQKIYARAHSGVSALRDKERLEAAFDVASRRAASLGIDLELPPVAGTRSCAQPLELIMIRSDGAAFACCSAMFAGGGPNIPLGRLDESGIQDLWNAPAAQNARALFYGLKHEPGPCDGCGFRVFTPEAMERFLE